MATSSRTERFIIIIIIIIVMVIIIIIIIIIIITPHRFIAHCKVVFGILFGKAKELAADVADGHTSHVTRHTSHVTHHTLNLQPTALFIAVALLMNGIIIM